MLLNKRSRAIHSAKYIEKRRKKLFVGFFVYFGALILILGLIIGFLHLGFLQISSVTVGGTTSIKSEDVEKIVKTQLEGSYLYVIPKSNTLFYPKNAIIETVKNDFKRIKNLEVSRASFSKLSLNIEEKFPSAIVCVGFHNEDIGDDDCYFADESSYVYEKSPQFSEGVYPKYYVATGDDKNILGTIFASSTLFSDLQLFWQNAGKSNISPTGLFIGEDGNYELYVKNSDSSEAVIYFDDRQPFEKTLSNFVLFWNDAMKKKKNATTTPIFEYINLRYGNNIFYATK